MIKKLITPFLLLLSFQTIAQPTSAVLNANNIKAVVNANGTLFWDFENGQFITDETINGEQSTLRTSGLWLAGFDPGGNLQAAVQGYHEDGRTDFVPGLIPDNGSADVIETNKIWRVTRQDVELHLLDFADNGVIDNPIQNIFDWPARGNEFFSAYNAGLVLPLREQGYASFWDANGNGVYNPSEGEYPTLDIRGCNDTPIVPTEMLWFGYHDNAIHLASQLSAMIIEIQCTVFAFDCEAGSPIDNTIFTTYKMINFGEENLFDMHVGLYNDFDIGNPNDDFFGSDLLRSLVFAYNGDEFDEDGYESEIPVMAVDVLRSPLTNNGTSASIKTISQIPDFEVTNGIELFNVMQGLNLDGTPDLNNGIYFTDNPNDPDGWSEVTANNTPGNRSVLTVFDEFDLPKSAINELLVAYSSYQESGNTPLENVNAMYTGSDEIQALFDNCFDIDFTSSACSSTTSIATTSMEKNQMHIFPNPAINEINIQLNNKGIEQVLLRDVNGRIVFHQKWEASPSEVNLNLGILAKGIYFLESTLDNKNRVYEKIVIQ